MPELATSLFHTTLSAPQNCGGCELWLNEFASQPSLTVNLSCEGFPPPLRIRHRRWLF